jgi:hypothetical protein
MISELSDESNGVQSLDPHARYLFCRPLGGMNDTFCQIESALRYATKHNRILLVDSADSGLVAPFFELFELKANSLPVVSVGPEVDWDFFDSLTTYPKAFEGRLGKIFRLTRKERKELLGQGSDRFLPTGDYSEQLVLHHSWGGGRGSQRLLEQITCRPELRTYLLRVSKRLPVEYSACHVRQTDLKMVDDDFLEEVKERIGDGLIAVLSDNSIVLNRAKDLFGSSQLVYLSEATRLVRSGAPVHNPERYDDAATRRNIGYQAVSDLFVASHATDFYYGKVWGRHRPEKHVTSGFTFLMTALASNPSLRTTFFGSNQKLSSSQRIHSARLHEITGFEGSDAN